MDGPSSPRSTSTHGRSRLAGARVHGGDLHGPHSASQTHGSPHKERVDTPSGGDKWLFLLDHVLAMAQKSQTQIPCGHAWVQDLVRFFFSA